MLFKSQIFSMVAGSIAGLTYARARSGMYTRARRIPVNKRSDRQRPVRARFAWLSTRWREVLTQTPREAWTNYAALTPQTGKLGDDLLLTGLQMYLRCNTVRGQANEDPVDDGPIIPGNAAIEPSFVQADGTRVEINYDEFAAWNQEDFAGLAVRISRQLTVATNVNGQGLAFKLRIEGEAGGGGNGRKEIDKDPWGFRFNKPSTVFVALTAYRQDGRVSNTRLSYVRFS